MNILTKVISASLITLALTNSVQADECEYWHEMFGTHVPDTSTEYVGQDELQGVDAYYLEFYDQGQISSRYVVLTTIP